MRDIKIDEFGKDIIKNLFNILDELYEKNMFEKSDLIFRSKDTYDGYKYEISIDEADILAVFRKNDGEKIFDILSVPVITPEHVSSMRNSDLDKLIDALATIKVNVFNVSMLEKMAQDLNLNTLNNSYSILKKELEKYYSSMVYDIKAIFDVYEIYKNNDIVNYGNYHKYKINGKQVIVFSNTSCVEEYFTIYEKDKKTNTIRIITDTVDSINKNKKYNIRTVVIGKYRNIIEDYLKNHEPICVIEKDKVKYINTLTEIIDLNHHAKYLSAKYNIQRILPYNQENMVEMLNYLTFNNMYTLLTHGLWSINGEWKKNEDGEYFFVFKSEIDNIKYHDEMVYDESGLKYVSITAKNSAMLSLPNGKIKDEWLNLIVESYFYIKENKEKLPLCNISDEEFNSLKMYLKENNYIN